MKRWGQLLAIVLLAVIWVIADQRRLVTGRYECAVEGLPEEFDGFRIVQLSDLHGAEFGADNAALTERVAALRPDLIALTGDLVEKREDLPVTERLLPALSAIAPTYFVSGNHEWGSGLMDELDGQLTESGVVRLANRWQSVSRNGKRILLCGVEDPNSYADMITPAELVSHLREEEGGETPVILLGHRNNWVEKYPELDVDVILCGHCHGGIVRLPFLGGLFSSNASLFPTYDAGAYAGEKYTMIVSRGLGIVHGLPRIGNPPEIVELTLRCA